MTRIDFYLLSGHSPGAQEKFACKLAEKAYKLGNRLYIHTESEAQTRHLDELLWTFRAGSFVPHERYSQGTPATAPILLGHDQEPDNSIDVLVNMSHEIPAFFSRFERVAEIVPDQETSRQAGRDHYRFYRDRGYALDTHKI
jgi:DNA polymerase-3 subunit chi